MDHIKAGSVWVSSCEYSMLQWTCLVPCLKLQKRLSRAAVCEAIPFFVAYFAVFMIETVSDANAVKARSRWHGVSCHEDLCKCALDQGYKALGCGVHYTRLASCGHCLKNRSMFWQVAGPRLQRCQVRPLPQKKLWFLSTLQTMGCMRYNIVGLSKGKCRQGTTQQARQWRPEANLLKKV